MKQVVDLPQLNQAFGQLGTPTSLLVKGGGLHYSCGIPPLDSLTGEIVQGTIEEQTEAVLKLMKVALEGAGSSLAKVVKTTVYITDNSHFAGVNAVYKKYFPDRFPARSFVAVTPWPLPFNIEIDCIATE
ncbi:Rid family hydrolase [Roseibium porphyridii]|uniref:Rid family hydrolase n=1 Tax=Roseibium porphyridii TaxID=2866279 RepID=A0ABY8F9D4_9HYPH|nr:Rid family hydrolase [Roseibium sp. KMA01]WFE89855.1 Rid family hydrolase [Roseibium sp. KMA01]